MRFAVGLLCGLILAAALAFAQVRVHEDSGTHVFDATELRGVPLASLGTPFDGTQKYCNDCTPNTDPCTGSGTGAYATRLNGAWVCGSAGGGATAQSTPVVDNSIVLWNGTDGSSISDSICTVTTNVVDCTAASGTATSRFQGTNVFIQGIDTNTVDGDVSAGFTIDCSNTGSGTEQCNILLQQQIGGVLTTVTNWVSNDAITIGNAARGSIVLNTVGADLTLDNNGIQANSGQPFVANPHVRYLPTDSPPTCAGGTEGSIYYDASLNEICFCDGASWAQVDGGGAC